MTGVLDFQTGMPVSVIAGDVLKAQIVELGNVYPSGEGYSLSWVFTPARGGTPETISGVWHADGWRVTVPGATTAAWTAGSMIWVARLTKSGETATAGRGEFTVLPNPGSADLDQRSHAKRVLDLLEAAIEGRASRTDLEHQFEDGRRLKVMTHKELLDMRNAYASRVAAEERKASGKGPARVLVSL